MYKPTIPLALFILLTYIAIFPANKTRGQEDSLKNLYRTALSVEDKLGYLDKIARIYQGSQLDSAKVYAKKEIGLAIANKNDKYTALGYNWLGNAFLYGGFTDSALVYFRKAYEVNIGAGNKLYAAYSLQTIAGCYFQNSIYDTAIILYKRTLDDLIELDNKHGMANAHVNLAMTYGRTGNYDRAIEHTYKSIQVFQGENNKKGEAHGYMRLADTYNRMDNYDSAIFYYRKTGSIIGANSKSLLSSTVNNNMGVAHEGLHNYDSALYYYYKALETRLKINYVQGIADTYMNIGNILTYRKQYDSAFAYLRKARIIYSGQGYNHGLAHNYFVTGNLYDSIHEYDSAKAYHIKCYQLASEHLIPEYISQAAYGLSHAYNMLGQNGKALGYYKVYKNYQDSLFNKASSEKIGWARARFLFDKQLIIEQRKRGLLKKYIFVVSAIAMVLIFLLWFVFRQLKLKKKLIEKLISKDNAIGCPPPPKTYNSSTNTMVAGKRQVPDEKTIGGIKAKLTEWEKKGLSTNHNVDIESVAIYCGTNPNYLSYVLNQSMQMKFTEWVNSLRLRKAKELLADKIKTNRYNISVIAEESGFKNKVTFYKYFKQDMAITPKQYIKSLS